MDAELGPCAFEIVEADYLVVGAQAYLAKVPVAVDGGINQVVEGVEQRCILNLVHHLINVFFLSAQVIRAHLGPILLVVKIGFSLNLDGRALDGILEVLAIKGDVGIAQLAGSDYGHSLCRVAEGYREIGIEPVRLEEPAAVRKAAVLIIKDHVAQPVDIAAALHLGVDGHKGILLGVDFHLSFEGRGADAVLRPVVDNIGLSVGDSDRVHDEIVVVEQAARLDRGRKLHVKGVDKRIVEVALQVHTAGKLTEKIGVGVDAGNLVGDYPLVVKRRVATVVTLCYRLGYHHRQVLHTRNRRGVQIVEYEIEIAFEGLAAKLLARVGQIEFHPVVNVTAVVRTQVGVVAGSVLVDVGEQALDFSVVRLYNHARKFVFGEFEGEVHLIEGPEGDFDALGLVAKYLADKNIGFGVSGLEEEIAFHIRAGAHGGSFEEEADKGHTLPVQGINDPSPDFGCLGEEGLSAEQKTQQDENFSFHFSKIPKQAEPEPDIAAYTAPRS